MTDQFSTLWRAAEIMAEATGSFVQQGYGYEGLQALIDAGWRLVPPEDTTATEGAA